MPRFLPIEECQEIVEKDIERIPDKYKKFADETRRNRELNPWKRMVVGILTCDRTQNRLASYLTIFGDIFKEFGLDYYIIRANPDIETEDGRDFVVDHETRIFTAKAKESYETLAHKVAIFYSYIYNFTDYEYVIKSDDGCLLTLNRIIEKLDEKYMGSVLKPTLNSIHCGKCSERKYNKMRLDFGHDLKVFDPSMSDELYESLYHIRLAGGGYGYRTHRDALQHIDKYKSHVLSLELSYEDVLFGQIFFLEGIQVTWHGIGRYHQVGPK